ncbi:MAG: phosphoribosylformylglycinamidine cyclo-ligase [Nitrospirae bacterium]|nr:phosphoribosylformylglycinamidine cyclo-ligase [Nitrospirota bacterium]
MSPRMTYKDAGVDIAAGNAFVQRIKPMVRKTFRPEVIGDLGGFGGLFRLDTSKYKDPILVSGTDGVGTKLKVAFMMDRHDTVGIDLVAMCVNDIAVSGAEPLFFLDYIATGKLHLDKMTAVVSGIAEGCRQAGCALIGGETAEMPSMYAEGEYDLAGFAVGVVERSKVIDGSRVVVGDVVVGIASTGLHSNGYSLARKVFFEKLGYGVDARIAGWKKTLGEELLTPTRIYVPSLQRLIAHFDMKAAAHITGGGLTENIPRVLPEGVHLVLHPDRWKIPPIFPFLEREGGIPREEMYRDFNMGIGMVVILPGNQADHALSALTALGEQAFLIGEVCAGGGGVVYAFG